MGARGLNSFNTRPYMTSKGKMVMRGNIGTCGSKDFDGRPIVTCDKAIITAKRCRSRGFDVRPIVTCDNGIITAWVHGLKGFDTWLIVM